MCLPTKDKILSNEHAPFFNFYTKIFFSHSIISLCELGRHFFGKYDDQSINRDFFLIINPGTVARFIPVALKTASVRRN